MSGTRPITLSNKRIAANPDATMLPGWGYRTPVGAFAARMAVGLTVRVARGWLVLFPLWRSDAYSHRRSRPS